jgi:hypothetical protein
MEPRQWLLLPLPLRVFGGRGFAVSRLRRKNRERPDEMMVMAGLTGGELRQCETSYLQEPLAGATTIKEE